jgi:Uma2 family endonuclease
MLSSPKIRVGPADHGRRMSLDEFYEAEVAEGYRYELSRGVIDVSDIPGVAHFLALQALMSQLCAYKVAHREVIHAIGGAGECKMPIAPFDSERHPDLSIYLDEPPNVDDVWSYWIPKIVVEVVTPSTRETDYRLKPDEYLQFGVREYWIVDEAEQQFTVLRRHGGRWATSVVKPPALHRTHLLPGLELSIAEVFAAATPHPPEQPAAGT